MIRALVLAHEPDALARQIEFRLVERGVEVHTHVITPDHTQPNHSVPFPSLADYDIVIPMGSMRSLTRKHEIDSWVHDELRLLRQAHEDGQPILGICFGGQLMAEALGGSVEEAPVTEIGWYTIEALAGAANPAGPGPWMQWHHDRFTPPAEAEILAVNENAVQLFRIGSTVGTQFHPEIDVDHIATWLELGEDPEYFERYGIDPAAVLADVAVHEADSIRRCHAFVDWWLDEVVMPALELEVAAP